MRWHQATVPNAGSTATVAVGLVILVFSFVICVVYVLSRNDRDSGRRAPASLAYFSWPASRDGSVEFRRYTSGQLVSCTAPILLGDGDAARAVAARSLMEFIDASGAPMNSPLLTRFEKAQCTVYALLPIAPALSAFGAVGITVTAMAPFMVATIECKQGVDTAELQKRVETAARMSHFRVQDWRVTAQFEYNYSEYWVLLSPMNGPPYQDASMTPIAPLRIVSDKTGADAV